LCRRDAAMTLADFLAEWRRNAGTRHHPFIDAVGAAFAANP